MSSKQSLGPALALLFLSTSIGPAGCSCKGRVDTTITRLTFEYPTGEALITSADDSSPATEGIQINVAVVVEGVADGATIVLTNSEDVDSSGVPTPTTAQTSGGRVLFAGYTLPVGTFTLRAALEGVATSDTCDGARCVEVALTVVENVCQLNTPRDGDVLTEDAYPEEPPSLLDPLEVDVVLDCTGLQEGDLVALRVGGGPPQVSPVDGTGRVTFVRVALSEGANALAATSDVDAQGAGGAGTTTATVTVSTGRCTAALEEGDGSRLLFQDDLDQDPNNGLQLNLPVLTSCDQASTVELWVRGPGDSSYALVAPSSVDAFLFENNRRFLLRDVSLPESDPATAASPTAELDVTVVAVVTETATGRKGVTIPTRYWVDTTVPEYLLVTPSDGACLGPLQDLDSNPANGVQIEASGSTFTGAEEGTELWFQTVANGDAPTSCTTDAECTGAACRAGTCQYVATAAGSAFLVPSVTMPAGSVTVTVRAVDPAGNIGQPAVLALDVFATAPTVAISSPTDGASLGVANDDDPLTAGVQTNVTLALTNVPGGTLGTLTVSGQAPLTFVPPTGDTQALAVPATLLDGSRTLRARVQDSCGNDVASAPLTVFASSTPPDITVVAYEGSNNGFLERRDIPDGATTRDPLLDLDVYVGAAAGSRTLDLTVQDGVQINGGIRECITVMPGNVHTDSLTLTAADDGHLFAGLSLLEGINCITVSVDDGLNPATTTLLVRHRSAAPTPVLLSPDPAGAPVLLGSADDVDGITPGLNYDVAVAIDVPPHAGAGEAVLSFGGFGEATVSVPGNSGDATATTPVIFAGVGLPDGAYDLEVRYRDGVGNESNPASAAVMVDYYDTSDVEVVLVAPPSGAHRQGAASTPIEVRSLGSTDPTTCTLMGGTDVGSATPLTVSSNAFAGPSTTFDVTLAELGASTGVLWADCESVTTQVITLTIDDTSPDAPTFANEDPAAPGRLVFDGGGYINANTPDTSSAPSLQHNLRVVVGTGGEAPIGWTVTTSVTQAGAAVDCGGTPNGAVATYTTVLAGGGDPTLVTFYSAELGNTQGPVLFSATVTDRAGNTSGTTTACLMLDTMPPSLSQLNPSPAQAVLTRQDDANFDPTYVDVAFQYNAGGAQGNLLFDVAPAPATGPSLPATEPASSSTSLPSMGFADGNYVATATVTDVAGNTTTLTYDFEIQGQEARITWISPATGGTLNRSKDVDPSTAGFQGRFSFQASAFQPGTPMRLCSNLPPAGAATPCKYGPDGTEGSPDAGVVVGTVPLSGLKQLSSGFFNSVTLAQGTQQLHAEATESDGNPDTYSTFFTFLVDSVPPTIDSLNLTSNSTGNDSPSLLRLGAAEGAVVSNRLQAPVTVTVSGAHNGALVRVYTNQPVARTVAGSGTLTGGTASFTVSLPQGTQTIFAEVSDANGNLSDAALNPQPNLQVLVDYTPGTVTLASPAFNPYTSTHGTPAAGTLPVSVGASASDNQGLTGASITLQRYSDAGCTTGIGGTDVTIALSAGQGSISFAGYPLVLEANHLRVTLTDATGNTATSSCRQYNADFTGPDLTLGAAFTPPGAACGDSAANPCVVTTVESNGRAQLNTAANDLLFTLTNCASAPSIETCNAFVRLQSRLAGSVSAFTRVYQSELAASTNYTPEQSYAAALTSTYAFDPGVVREVRLAATDEHGNTSYSSSVFLQLDFSGFTIDVTRLEGGSLTSDVLDDDTYWGIAQNLGGAAQPYTVDLQVDFQDVTGSASPVTDVLLTVQSPACGGTCPTYNATTLSAASATFSAVELYATTDSTVVTNTVLVEVLEGACDSAGTCSRREYLNVVADLDPPSFQFDRCSLCDLEVPLLLGGACGACADANDDDAADVDTLNPALWNAQLDPDGNPSNGFSTTAVTPLRVLLQGVESGSLVTISSSEGGLSGTTALATNCGSFGTCAELSDLSASSLAGNGVHILSASVSDRAGNPGVPDPYLRAGGDDIHARTDVLAPASPVATVCIGESTTPAVVQSGAPPANPEDDPATFEAPQCAAACGTTGACSRLDGEATLTWVAPGDDGDTGGSVASYDIVVVARGVDYTPGAGITLYESCADVLPDSTGLIPNPVEQRVSIPATATPGGTEIATVSGLYPHRDYCFSVRAIDDLGNRSNINGFQVQRSIPLTTHPEVARMVPATLASQPRDNLQDAALFRLTGSSATYFGFTSANVGDLDGDGRDDFVVSEPDVAPIKIYVFMSTVAPTSPVVVTLPTAGEPIVGPYFAGGDFDQDGNSDLFINIPGMSVPGAAFGGVVYIYYGGTLTGGTMVGIRRDTASDATLPDIRPDVALFGSDGAYIGFGGITVANVDGQNGDDLVIGAPIYTAPSGPPLKVFGFHSSGDRTRFPAGAFGTAKINLDLATAGPGVANRADFAIPQPSSAGFFPSALSHADLNGDGVQDIVLSDTSADDEATPPSPPPTANSGEVYVYRGNAGLLGALPALDVSTAPMLHRLRYRPAANACRQFGFALLGVPAPRPGDDGDWLLINCPNPNRVYAFKGTSNGTLAFQPPASDLHALDTRNWNGIYEPYVGTVMGSAPSFSSGSTAAVVLGPGSIAGNNSTTNYGVFVLDYDVLSDSFVQRAILYGSPSNPGGFGTSVVGLAGFTAMGRAEVLVAQSKAAGGDPALFIYR